MHTYSLLIYQKRDYPPNCAVKQLQFSVSIYLSYVYYCCLLLLVSWVWSPPASSVTNVAG